MVWLIFTVVDRSMHPYNRDSICHACFPNTPQAAGHAELSTALLLLCHCLFAHLLLPKLQHIPTEGGKLTRALVATYMQTQHMHHTPGHLKVWYT
jgi:hypothetical protein